MMKGKNIASVILSFLIAFFSTLEFSGCSALGQLLGGGVNLPNVGDTNANLWAYSYSGGSYYQLDAIVRYVGSKCIVAVEVANEGLVSESLAQSIGWEFENNIYGIIRTKFGTEPDVNSDGHVYILILDIIDGGAGVVGYFDPRQEMEDTNSNKRDMFFMDCSPFTPGSSIFNITLAHEFQHMINFNQKYFVQSPGAQYQDTWITEGLSSAAESVYTGTNMESKINYYNSDPYNDIAEGQAFVAWDANGSEKGGYNNIFGSYATVYLFFQWLRIQSANGDGIYKEIMDRSEDNYQAVEAIANSRLYAGSWQDYMRDWYIANLLNNASGKYGYHNEISLTPPTLSAAGTPQPLYPGEGVYVDISTSYTITQSSPVDYAGVNTGTGTVDTNGFSYSGTKLISYNYSGNASGSTNYTGTLPNIVNKGITMKKLDAFAQDVLSGKILLPIDAVIRPGGKSSIGEYFKKRNTGKPISTNH